MAAASIELIVRQEGREDQVLALPAGVFTVGSDQDNKIVLADSMISWRHAIISHSSDSLHVEDLGSSTGTYIDGERVNGRVEIRPGQKLQLGTFVLERPGPRGAAAPPAAPRQAEAPPPAPPPPAEAPPPLQPQGSVAPPQAPPPAPTPAPPKPNAAPARALTIEDLDFVSIPAASDEAKRAQAEFDPRNRQRLAPVDAQKIEIKKQVHTELLKRLDIRRMTADQVTEADLGQRARHTVAQIISDVSDKLPEGINPHQLAKEICEEALGLGPLEDLLANEDITEIMVNGPSRIYVERKGRLTLTDRCFIDDASVMAIIERIVSPIGRRIDESSPFVDARLPDGSRVNAIINPLSLSGPCITIRKFAKEPFSVEQLIQFGSMTRDIADFTAACVQLRKNIVVSGGTGTGKTTMLNVVSNFLPTTERIVTIEDAAELRLIQDHVITLESRPANMEGKGAIGIRDLVRNSLRMRPDRIVVGECRGGEALDMLQAMNTGHDGSLTTVHANAPRDVVSRLETMVLMSGMDLPVRAIREQIGSAIQLIVHLTRFSDGTRRVSRVTEVCGMEGDKITMQDLWEFEQTGINEDGRVLGTLKPTGAVPTFMEEFDLAGIYVNKSMFDTGGMQARQANA